MWAAAPQAGLGNDAVPAVVGALWAAVMAREGRRHRSPAATRRRGTTRALTFALLSRTRLHGLRQVCVPRGSLGRRVFWLLALCTCLGLLLSWSSNRLLHWMSFPTYTRVHTEWAKELAFPVVTICNNNPIRLYKLTKSDLYFAGHWLGLLLANRTVRPLVLDLLQEDRVGWFGKLSDFRLFLPPRNFEGTNLEFMNRLSHQLDDMLLSCKYRGEPCGAHNFSSVFTRYGKCYMFNAAEEGKSLRTTMKGGTGNGLEIMLDIQQDEYLPVWGDTEDTAFEAGVRVQIHSQAEPPFVHELGFGVAPGFQTFVATQEQRLTFLPPPWGECESKTLESGFFPVYSVTACRIDCETRYIVENCNCRMVHMPGDASYCTPEQYKDCAEPALDNVLFRALHRHQPIIIIIIIILIMVISQAVCDGEQQLHVPHSVQCDALQQRAFHGQDTQQDFGALPAEEVQQVGEVHRR
ncbi:acid-sensing ion channel 2 isoform X3 [Hippocampus comes]|uniref:acid-sensing ion channel 2 isoform X3 n=1 Tax=Hippocampus comes TaxID=109280 RepID=UPI00094EB393|nr:PREDICTED: acid-sensing ion channel 2 isoform X3 [Hippocampus comes]